MYGLCILFSSVISYRSYRKLDAKDGVISIYERELHSYSVATYNLTTKVEELESYIKFMEQSIPDLQKRNAKAKIVKEIVLKEMKDTKQNNFKSDREFNDYILSVVDFSEKYRVPTSLILAVSRAESNFNPRAVSSTNAQGIMQIMPDTTKYCVTVLKKVEHDPFYARDSVECGTWYLKQMLNIFNDQSLVIQAYNAGPAYILKFKGQELPEETANYHETVTGLVAEYKTKFRWEN